ncbi:MAG TPA: ABC transporter substrate-binding protein [Gemmatimonadaceae bacterium]|nr:ABC transporter substrate-binding protein [Gemmatimonadaceae bacterium]
MAALTGCTTGGGSSDDQASLDLGSFVDAASLDPAQSDVGHYMPFLQPAYDTLIKLNDQGDLVPMLATSWDYVDEAKTTMELKLRDDVKFSDGTPLTAEAVVSSLGRFKASNGPRSTALASVESVNGLDDTTVQLHLGAPDPALAHNLALVAGMITNPAVADTDLASVPAGTGPYVLDTKATRRGDVYVFERNENYYDPEAFPFDSISIRVLTDPTARLNAAKTGQVDAVYGAPSQLSEARSSGLTVVSTPGDWQGLFLIDRKGAATPALGDVRVRQALNYAIDGDAILKSVAFEQGTPTTQVFYPNTPAFEPKLDDRYPYDPDKAKELLQEAGYADGFTLRMPSSDAFLPEVYPIIEQQLADVGITIEYDPQTPAAGLGPYLSGQYSSFFFSWGASQNWLDASLLLSEGGAWNPYHVADPKITELMTKIAAADGEAQDALYKELSAYIVDQAWFDPFYVVSNLMFVGADVTVTPQPQQIVPSIYNYRPAK